MANYILIYSLHIFISSAFKHISTVALYLIPIVSFRYILNECCAVEFSVYWQKATLDYTIFKHQKNNMQHLLLMTWMMEET